MNEQTEKDCIEFLNKELAWLKESGHKNQPYAQKRLKMYQKIKSLLEKQVK